MKINWKTTGACGTLTIGALLLFHSVFGLGFVSLDDPLYIVNNFHLRQGLVWREMIWSFQTVLGGYWMPMVWLSYLIDSQIYGNNLGGYHATNLLLHIANALLLFLILKRITGAFWRSFMVAALFVWHPMHVESVAWLTERKDVLSTLFWMLATWAYVGYAEKGGFGRYLIVTIFFTLGLMSKPMLVTLPFVLLLLDWWPLRRLQSRSSVDESNFTGLRCIQKTAGKLFLEKVPLLVLAIAFSLLTVILQNRSGAVAEMTQVSLLSRTENALVSYGLYVEKLIWPADLSVFYPLRQGWPAWEIVAVLVFLAAISDLAIRQRKNHPYLLTGWLWYLGTLLPVIGIIQVGSQGMADRFTYVPAIGLFIVFAWGGYELVKYGIDSFNNDELKRRINWAAAGLSAVALALCGFATGRQLQYWRSDGALFKHALDVDPENFMARCAYGMSFFDQREWPQAIAELRKAIDLLPRFAHGHALLGKALSSSGDKNGAAAELQTALDLDPSIVDAHTDLGSIFLEQKLPEKAKAEFASAIRYDPDNPLALALMGQASLTEGKLDEAREELSEALRLDPRLYDVHCQIAMILSAQHQSAEAIRHYRIALGYQPGMVEALNNLAWILATDSHAELRNGPEAVQLASRACALTKNSMPIMLGTLAAAYAENGDFDNAISNAQKAHDLAVAKGRLKVAARNEELLTLFRAHRPYRE